MRSLSSSAKRTNGSSASRTSVGSASSTFFGKLGLEHLGSLAPMLFTNPRVALISCVRTDTNAATGVPVDDRRVAQCATFQAELFYPDGVLKKTWTSHWGSRKSTRSTLQGVR